MEQALTQILKEQCQKSIQEASDQEIYDGFAVYCKG